jgi:hypothetical protein
LRLVLLLINDLHAADREAVALALGRAGDVLADGIEAEAEGVEQVDGQEDLAGAQGVLRGGREQGRNSSRVSQPARRQSIVIIMPKACKLRPRFPHSNELLRPHISNKNKSGGTYYKHALPPIVWEGSWCVSAEGGNCKSSPTALPSRSAQSAGH